MLQHKFLALLPLEFLIKRGRPAHWNFEFLVVLAAWPPLDLVAAELQIWFLDFQIKFINLKISCFVEWVFSWLVLLLLFIILKDLSSNFAIFFAHEFHNFMLGLFCRLDIPCRLETLNFSLELKNFFLLRNRIEEILARFQLAAFDFCSMALAWKAFLSFYQCIYTEISGFLIDWDFSDASWPQHILGHRQADAGFRVWSLVVGFLMIGRAWVTKELRRWLW